MKEKIMNSLKSTYLDMGVGEKALDGVASLLEKNINDENQITEAVKNAESLIKAIQSDIDRERRRASEFKKEIDELRKETSKKEEKPKEDTNREDNKLLAELEALRKEQQELKERLNQKSEEENRLSLLNSVKGKLKEKNIPEAYYNKVLENKAIKSNEEIDAIVEDMEKAYSDLKVSLSQERFSFDNKPQVPMKEDKAFDSIAQAIGEETKNIINSKK